MKRKINLLFLVVIASLISVCGIKNEVNARELGENIEFSYLLTEDALIGHMGNQTRGIYLAEGDSIINKISSNKIGAGGMTSAAVRCEVSITSIVERQTSTGWARVTSWTQTNENAFSAMISKSLTVGTGYYYRVRSSHYAATDVSSSGTGALWMGN